MMTSFGLGLYAATLLVGSLMNTGHAGEDELEYLLATLEETAPPPNMLYGMGVVSGATETNRWESRSRYRISDRLEPGFEDTHPRLHDYTEFVNRYYYKLNHAENGWNSSIQVDQISLGLNRYILDGKEYNSIDLLEPSLFSPMPNHFIRLEKANLTKNFSNAKLELGDMGGAFGRGIALNIRSNKIVDIDTSLRGVKYTGNFGRAEIMALSGLSNRQQVSRDNPNLGLYQDVPHLINGAQVMLYGVGSATLGFHGVTATFGDVSTRNDSGIMRIDEPVDATIVGMDAEVYGLAGLDWYFEGNVFQYYDEALSEGGEHETGYTGYVSASAYPGILVVLLEGKISKDSERINLYTSIDNWEVATPPSLEYERMITEDSSATVNSNDVIGGRIRVDVPIKPAVFTPYVAVSAFHDKDLEGLHFNIVPETIVHPIAGVQYTENEVVVLMNMGYRIDDRDSVPELDNGVDQGQDRLMHFDGEIGFPLFGHEALELNTSMWKFMWGDNPVSHNDFVTVQNAVVWRHGEDIDFILYQDYTTNTQLQSVGNITDEIYLAGEVKYRPTPETTLRVLAGAYKAGIRCSGGQCRTLPGFNGVEVAYSSTF